MDKQVADIVAQSKSKGTAAKARQQDAGALRAQVPNQTAVQGEQTLKQAQEIARQADAMEVEAANLDAEAAKVSPQSGEIQLQIDRLSSQKELLEKAQKPIDERKLRIKTPSAGEEERVGLHRLTVAGEGDNQRSRLI